MKKKIVSYLLALSLVVTGFICVDTVDIRAVDDAVVEKAVVSLESVEVDSVKDDTIVDIEKLVQDTVEEEPVEEVGEVPVEELIRRAAERYGIPFDIALAIARWETGWFKSGPYVNQNNVGGMMYKVKGTDTYKLMSFDTLEEGVDAYVRNLYNGYFALGLDTPEEIGPKYCPGDQSWIDGVRELMTYE